MAPVLLKVDRLHRTFVLPRHSLREPAARVDALKGVSFEVQARTNFGIVGESGSGKSTLARLIMALDRPTSGHVELLGQNLFALNRHALRDARKSIQMVFQDPYSSLDPRQTVERIITEPLTVTSDMNAAGRRRRGHETLESVGLRATDLDKYPHEFSGGQRQRIAIARALITRPRLIVADEPVSALDVSVQAQVLNLMGDLCREYGVTFLLISHDLAVVNHLCAHVVVMNKGEIVEQGPPDRLFESPQHPYTRALVDAVPRIQPRARRPETAIQVQETP